MVVSLIKPPGFPNYKSIKGVERELNRESFQWTYLLEAIAKIRKIMLKM